MMEVVVDDMQKTVAKLNNPQNHTVKEVINAVLTNIHNLYGKYESSNIRQMIGDKLSELGGAGAIWKYMYFIIQQEADENRVKALFILLNVCWNYSHSSLKMAKDLATSDFLLIFKQIFENCKDYDRNQVSSSRILI